MTPELLSSALGIRIGRAEKWATYITEAMERFEINTPLRQAAFLSQIGHESCGLVCTREIWCPQQCAWQAHYEGRADLGNTEPGDGMRFMGRGLIQITGRSNYRDCGVALGQDFENSPALLELPHWAALSAGWYWQSRRINALADKRLVADITRKINGGLTGLADRLALYQRACVALGVEEAGK